MPWKLIQAVSLHSLHLTFTRVVGSEKSGRSFTFGSAAVGES